MAVMYVRGAGMTANDRDEEDDSISSLKEETEYRFPDKLQDSVVSVVPGDLDPAQREALRKRIEYWEKDSLISRKSKGDLAGVIRDTRNRYGEPKQWDHLQFSLDRQESEHYSRSDLERARNIMLDIAARDISGQHLKMSISRIHTDTGNTHIDLLVHRHPYNIEKRESIASDDITNSSRLASLVEAINKALRADNLPPIVDVKKQDGQSLYEETATSDAAKQAVNRMLVDEGGIPTQRTGAPVVPSDDEPRQPMARITDPDIKALERLLVESERDMKAAAQRLVSVQNAHAAHIERADLRTRIDEQTQSIAELEKALNHEQGARAEEQRIATENLAAKDAEIEQSLEREMSILAQLEQVKNTVTERDETIAGLNADLAGAQADIEHLGAKVADLGDSLASATSERDTALARAADLDAQLKTLSNQRDQLATALNAAREATLEKAATIAQQEATIADRDRRIEALSNKRDELSTALDAERKTTAQQVATIAERDRQIEVASKQRDELAAALDAAKKSAAEQEAAISKQAREIEQECAKTASVESANAALRERLTEAADQRKEMSDGMKEFRQMLDDLKRQREESQAEQSRQAQQITALLAELQQLREAPSASKPSAATPGEKATLSDAEAAEKRSRAEAKRNPKPQTPDDDPTPAKKNNGPAPGKKS